MSRLKSCDALLEDDVAVFRQLACHHDRKGQLRAVVEVEPPDARHRRRARLMFPDRRKVARFNLRVELVAFDRRHHDQRRRIAVQLEQRDDPVEQLRNGWKPNSRWP